MTHGADLLARARSLRDLVEAEADASDDELTMTKPVIEAFIESGLFHIMVPKALGGLEADSDTIIDVFEELAHQDGSTGWSQMANASATSYCAFLDPDLAAEMKAGWDVMGLHVFVDRRSYEEFAKGKLGRA